MRVKTVLNRVHKVKGFVYEKVRIVGDGIEVGIRPRKRSRRSQRGSRPIGSGCDRVGPGYDTLPTRRFAFVPMWALSVVRVYAMRRVDGPRCGVTVERVPWADGKQHRTRAYAVFLARWARRLSWREVATIFQTSLGDGVPIRGLGGGVWPCAPADGIEPCWVRGGHGHRRG